MWFILFLILLQAEELQNQMEQDYDIGWAYIDFLLSMGRFIKLQFC